MPRSKNITYKIMSKIKSKDTKPERMLSKSMWRLGLRYRKQYKIKGKPDFVFIRTKIAVFCDGDFWHGNNWKIRGLSSFQDELDTYSDFWKRKLLSNIERDREVNKYLESKGWKVIRFWESEILKNPEGCSKKVRDAYMKIMSK